MFFMNDICKKYKNWKRSISWILIKLKLLYLLLDKMDFGDKKF